MDPNVLVLSVASVSKIHETPAVTYFRGARRLPRLSRGLSEAAPPSDREEEDSVEKLRPRKTKGILPLLEDRVAVGQDSASPDCSGIELFVEFIVGIFV